jgi:hypothetical protein
LTEYAAFPPLRQEHRSAIGHGFTIEEKELSPGGGKLSANRKAHITPTFIGRV